MTARRDLAESVAAAERSIDDLFRPLAPQIAASVREHAKDGKITHAARRAILKDVDTILSQAYPARAGETSNLGIVIGRHVAKVAAKPVAAEVERIEKALKGEPVLLERMKRGR